MRGGSFSPQVQCSLCGVRMAETLAWRGQELSCASGDNARCHTICESRNGPRASTLPRTFYPMVHPGTTLATTLGAPRRLGRADNSISQLRGVAGYLQKKFSVFAVEFDTYPHRLRFKAKSRNPSLPLPIF
jgi:hypothetical protein